jgi:phosphatidylethanolamine/phosphatidyl-N-methylethanolamine N-methyltransferase
MRTAERRESARAAEFFIGFLRAPKSVGSVVPSSRALRRRIVEAAATGSAKTVIELGPGTGVVTREILAALPRDGRLLAIEIDPGFADLLESEIPDPRLHVFRGSATDLTRALASIGETAADIVISGIPFSTMSRDDAERTLHAVRNSLSPGGRFVAYQFRDHVRRLASPILGKSKVDFELRNVPPMRIYTWTR